MDNMTGPCLKNWGRKPGLPSNGKMHMASKSHKMIEIDQRLDRKGGDFMRDTETGN